MRKIAAFCVLVGLGMLCLGAASKGAAVSIRNLQFTPNVVEIKRGEAVTWVNNDDRDHEIYNDEIKSGTIKPGKSFTYQFPKVGSFPYGCSYHPRMRGTVVVSE